MASAHVDDAKSNAAWFETRTFQYAVIGMLAGILFPLVAIALELARRHFPVSISNVLTVQRSAPLLWIVETAPLFLGLVAAIAGRRQDIALEANKALTLREAELGSIRSDLEQIVAQRTEELDLRNAQMRAVIQFARQVAEFQELPPLLTTAVRALTERFNWQEVDLYLLDDSGQVAVLQASSSLSGRNPLKEGYRVPISDQSVVGRTVRRGRSYVSPPNPVKQEGSGRPPTSTPSGVQIALPLIARGRVTGALDVHWRETQSVSQSEMEIFQLAADQLAAAIENVRLVTQSRSTADQLQALTLRDTQIAWQQYLKNREIAYRFTPSGISSISAPIPRDGRGALSVQLALRGQKIGSITLHKRTGESWTPADQDMLEKAAAQVALALENARLLDETRHRAAQEQVISEISARLNRSLEVDAILQSAAREFAALPDVTEAEVVLRSPDSVVDGVHNQLG